MTDPYNPMEKKLELTFGALRLIHRARFGAAVATKSDLVLRDLSLFRDISAHSPVLIKITVTCTDPGLAAKIEPRAPRPDARLKAVEGLARAGLFTGISLCPFCPGWKTMRRMSCLWSVAQLMRGPGFIFPGFGVTTREGQREYFYKALDSEFPGLTRALQTTVRRQIRLCPPPCIFSGKPFPTGVPSFGAFVSDGGYYRGLP